MTTNLYWNSGYAVGDIAPITLSASSQNINDQVGVQITPIAISASGGSGAGYQYFASGLPAGLFINSSGVISGTPQGSGSGVIDVVVVDSANNASSPLLINYVITSITSFTWAPTSATKSLKPSVYNAKFGDGYEQNSPKGINWQAATWSLQFKGQTLIVAEGIDRFLSAQGGYLKFTWTPPDGSAQALWLCKQWQFRILPGGVNDVSATFIQQFGI